MSRDTTTDSNSSSDDEQPTRSTTDTYTFLENCVLNADHKALEEHLVSNPVQQSDLDRCLVRGLQAVQRKERELSHVAQALTTLLQSGAKWNSDTLLAEQKTPYHIICESPGDHHELLDMMINSTQPRIIDEQNIRMFNVLMTAVNNDNIYCFKCMVANGADVQGDDSYGYVWSEVARRGNFKLLKYLLNCGIDIDSTDRNGLSILWWVVYSGNSKDVRYLLDRGVAIPNYAPKERVAPCEWCKENHLIITYRGDEHWVLGGRFSFFFLEEEDKDPYIRAIRDNNLEIIKLLDERGSQGCKSFTALILALRLIRVDLASYLLNTYTYPLNIEYIIKYSNKSRGPYTLLTDPGLVFTVQPRNLLLDHGADPAKPMCTATSNAIMTEICYGRLEPIAQYIRSGVDINCRSYVFTNIEALLFEASILFGYHDVAEMLLVSGCSCGVFSLDNNHKFKNNLKPEVEKLMKEWKVQENNVTPLKQRCRCVILNHLSPRADLKIENLPLPGLMIKFLSIPELDAILDQ